MTKETEPRSALSWRFVVTHIPIIQPSTQHECHWPMPILPNRI